jgi:hypothetical protein
VKKCCFLAAALVVPALIAFAQPEKQPGKPGASPPGASQPTKPAVPGTKATDDALIAQEKKMWDLIKMQDWSNFGAAIADDFVFVAGDGFKDKAATLEWVKKDKLVNSSFSDWNVNQMGENAAVVAYKVNQEWTTDDGKTNKMTSYCSSAWGRQGGKWMVYSHQDTPESNK